MKKNYNDIYISFNCAFDLKSIVVDFVVFVLVLRPLLLILNKYLNRIGSIILKLNRLVAFGRWYISFWCSSEHQALPNSIISVKNLLSIILASSKSELLLIK
jgi:hypothetical protein